MSKNQIRNKPNLCPRPGLNLDGWTLALAAAGLISLGAVAQAEEAKSQVLTAVSSTTLSGYVDTSAIWMFGNGHNLPGRSFDGANKQDGFNLDAVNLVVEKPLDEGQWAAGYRASFMFGPDANALGTTSTGLNASDFAIREAYVSLRAPVGNGLDFKMGVWTTLLGYEVMESGSNPNFSRSYGFFMEPIIQTGLLASYKVNDVIAVQGGVSDAGANRNQINYREPTESLKSYTGAITLTAPDGMGALKGSTLSLGILDTSLANSDDWVNYYAGLTLPTPLKDLSVGVAYDYRANALYEGSYENAAALYLMYQATEKLKLANRLEYATGSGVGAFGVPIDPDKSVRLLGETLTLDYSLWANVITRAEFRWDHSLTGQEIFGDGNQHNALSLALNVIYKF